MKRIELSIIIGIVASLLIGSFTGFAGRCDDIRNSVVRLHILANSDSEKDQALKLAVRDAVLEGTAGLFSESQTKEQVEALAAGHLRDIEALAAAEITRQGYDYKVSARIINRFFDTRVYDSFTMPAGRYDAVQIEIGAGAGRNWWCVMFPPMCLPAAVEKEDTPLEGQIRELGEVPAYQPAFAVVEMIESFQQWMESGDQPPEYELETK